MNFPHPSQYFLHSALPSSLPRNAKHGKRKLPQSFIPGTTTVLCGRGKAYTSSPGNLRLRNIVTEHLQAYSTACTKTEKTKIVNMILAAVRAENPAEGIFVKQIENDSWWEVEDTIAREKVGCIIRDCLHLQYRSSTKAKLRKRKAAELGKLKDEEQTDEEVRKLSRQSSDGRDSPNSAAGKVEVRRSAELGLGVQSEQLKSQEVMAPDDNLAVDSAFIHSNSNPFWRARQLPNAMTTPAGDESHLPNNLGDRLRVLIGQRRMQEQYLQRKNQTEEGASGNSGFIAERLHITASSVYGYQVNQPSLHDMRKRRDNQQDAQSTLPEEHKAGSNHTYNHHHSSEELPDDISGIFDD